MKKKPSQKQSSLNEHLQGTLVDAKTVSQVQYAPKRRKTRDVAFDDGSSKRVNKETLQDYLLISKGYQPKYAGKPVEWFQERGAKPKK